jgi:ribosomal protein S18 acetylase RimI-like enzyme
MPAGVRRATAADVERCADILARAFQDDPGAVIFEPEPDRRRLIMPRFFRMFLLAGLAEGTEIVVPAGVEVAGVASWFGPERHGPSDAAMEAAGMADVVAAFGPAAAARMAAMAGEIEDQHARRMAEPHLRLDFFGVDPYRQASGIGSLLMAHGHAIADREHLPCYLETFTDGNVRYYERRGYAVTGTYRVGDGVPVYAMVRPNSSASAP